MKPPCARKNCGHTYGEHSKYGCAHRLGDRFCRCSGYFAPVLEAIRNLAPRKGSGITSVTISAGGKSVTLTSEDRERINRILKGEE